MCARSQSFPDLEVLDATMVRRGSPPRSPAKPNALTPRYRTQCPGRAAIQPPRPSNFPRKAPRTPPALLILLLAARATLCMHALLHTPSSPPPQSTIPSNGSAEHSRSQSTAHPGCKHTQRCNSQPPRTPVAFSATPPRTTHTRPRTPLRMAAPAHLAWRTPQAHTTHTHPNPDPRRRERADQQCFTSYTTTCLNS